MKIKIFLIIFFLIFLSSFVSASSENCDLSANIYIDFKAFDYEKNPSPYQYPYFREGDDLIIDKITVENTGNCSLPETYIKIIMITPENEERGFCLGQGKKINSIEVGEKEEIKRSSKYPYIGCIRTLDEMGKYEIEMKWNYYKNFNGSLFLRSTPAGYDTYINDQIRGQKYFNVVSRKELRYEELQRVGILVAVVLSATSIILSIITNLNSKKSSEKTNDILLKIYNLIIKNSKVNKSSKKKKK